MDHPLPCNALHKLEVPVEPIPRCLRQAAEDVNGLEHRLGVLPPLRGEAWRRRVPGLLVLERGVEELADKLLTVAVGAVAVAVA